MSLLLVPATRDNLEASIERSVDLSFARRYLSDPFIKEITRYSGMEGIRCWAMTKTGSRIFDRMRNGDEILLTEKGTGRFTHYGIVVGKIHDLAFGKALWPVAGKNPWENIYFLANVTKVRIDKARLIEDLGYSSKYQVPGVVMVRDEDYSRLGTISKMFEVPVFDNVREANPQKDFLGENVPSQGKRRVGHYKFSRNIKEVYGFKCSICGIEEPEFLIAGHISSWAEDVENRLNPQNGICLCSFHDKAFEHGYIGINDKFEVILNKNIHRSSTLYALLSGCLGKKITLPACNYPDRELLKKHREKHKLAEYGN